MAAREKVVQKCLSFLSDSNCAIVIDLIHFASSCQKLNKSFPENFHHTYAIKANPYKSLLKQVKSAGFGVECASIGELFLAIQSDFKPKDVVFDSPAKTNQELKKALELGVSINADNWSEVGRIHELLQAHQSQSKIGIRINPGVGLGQIHQLSVSTTDSKFGIPFFDDLQKEEFVNRVCQTPWISGVHVHVGSQGMALDTIAQGARIAVNAAELINDTLGKKQINRINIGGGLSVNYTSEEETPSFTDYADCLKKNAPQLFDGQFKVNTEIGRALAAKSGFVLSRVEYVKPAGPTGSRKRVATVQVGAEYDILNDLFLRTCYMPDKFQLRFEVYSPEGVFKFSSHDTSNKSLSTDFEYDIVGPLCFAGDRICKSIRFSESNTIDEGDIIAFLDTGAYTFGMWSMYCSRFPPQILVYSQEGNSQYVSQARKQLGMEWISQMWT